MKKSHLVAVEALLLVLVMAVLLSFGSHFGMAGFAIYEGQPSPSAGVDVYIRNGSNLNFDTDVVLKIGKTASGLEYRSLLQFDLSAVPAGSSIISSVMELYASTNNQPNMTISAYMLTKNWTENEVTWNNNTASTAWSNSGGDYSALLLDSINVTSSGQMYNMSITQAVRRWINASSPNYGILLVSQSAGSNNLTEFASSDNPSSSIRPIIWINYAENAAPTIVSISTNSNLANPVNVGNQVQFSVGWEDLESNPTQIFVCNSSSITTGGCAASTFCSTSLSSSNPLSCSYTAQASNNRTTEFWVSVCDSSGCSAANKSAFYVNHVPSISLDSPNGGETLNQSQGNFSVQFNVSDSDSDALFASLYYGSSQNSTAFLVASSIPLTSYCTDADGMTLTANNCTYPWDTQGIYGNYFLTIIVNDSHSIANDSSDNLFNVRSLEDNQPPNVLSQEIDSGTIYSGRKVQIYANVTDQNINTVWFSLNTTPQQNITMANTTNMSFNGTFTAPAIGIYEFKVYANDTLNNVNDTMLPVQFTVVKPAAVTQSELSPSVALPLSSIQISAELNATDPLTNVRAYLNVPNGFVFMQGYAQSSYMGNFSSNQSRAATWFISTPINQSRYALNVTYSDDFSNSWQSNNTYVNVTLNFGGNVNSLSISDYPHVAVTNPYYAEASFKQNGLPSSADSVKISLYDPVGNLVVGPVDMAVKQLGTYNYTYNVPSAQTAGQWQTVVNATLSSVSYYATSFWKIVGALFDVREIQIENTAVDHLNISVMTENVGNAPTDLTLVWNLTRTDNNAVLDSGSDTFAVSTAPIRWYVYPQTSYVGQVKITFVGYYSQTEKAGAFEVFSTTAATGGEPVTPPTQPSRGGGGGGGASYPIAAVPKGASMDVSMDSEILLAKNIGKEVKVIVKNNGTEDLRNITLKLMSLDDKYYSITPESIARINSGDNGEFTLNFIVPDFTGLKEFSYEVDSDKASASGKSRLRVMFPAEYINMSLQKLKERSIALHARAVNQKAIDKLNSCDAYLLLIDESLSKQELIDAKIKVDEATGCYDDAEDIIDQNETSPTLDILGYKVPMFTVAIALIILIVLLIAVYLAYKKLDKSFFAKYKGRLMAPKTVKNEDFEDKIRRIEDKLRG